MKNSNKIDDISQLQKTILNLVTGEFNVASSNVKDTIERLQNLDQTVTLSQEQKNCLKDALVQLNRVYNLLCIAGGTNTNNETSNVFRLPDRS